MPLQVLDESLVVLAEIEGLIRESIGLESDTELGAVSEEEMARVPGELIDALEVRGGCRRGCGSKRRGG